MKSKTFQRKRLEYALSLGLLLLSFAEFKAAGREAEATEKTKLVEAKTKEYLAFVKDNAGSLQK